MHNPNSIPATLSKYHPRMLSHCFVQHIPGLLLMKCCNSSLRYGHPKPAFVYLNCFYQLPRFSRIITRPKNLHLLVTLCVLFYKKGEKFKYNIGKMRKSPVSNSKHTGTFWTNRAISVWKSCKAISESLDIHLSQVGNLSINGDDLFLRLPSPAVGGQQR